ncbi:hypothetical protein CR513_16012, partial [Mucuna pruriens]
MDRSMIDFASGRALMDKKPAAAARHLISNMASNTQQFKTRGTTSQMVNKVDVIDNLRLENQLTKLTSLVRQLAVRQHQARHLISNMASNTQQFGTRGAITSWMVNEVDVIDNLRLENQLTELTSLVRQLAVGQHQPSAVARVCGIFTSMKHLIDICPTWQETESDHLESVGSIGGY